MLPEVNYRQIGKLYIWLIFNWQNQLSHITATSYTNKQQTSYSVKAKQSYYQTESLKKAKAKNTSIYFSPKGHKTWNQGSFKSQISKSAVTPQKISQNKSITKMIISK